MCATLVGFAGIIREPGNSTPYDRSSVGIEARTLAPATLALVFTVGLYVPASSQTRGTLPDTLPPDPARDAYLDETARHLILGARAARDSSRLNIDSYTALIRERISVDGPTLRRHQPWVNGERAVRVRWSRTEPAIVHVLGARLRQMGVAPDDTEFFPGLRAERFAVDPLDDPFRFGLLFAGASEADVNVHSPLEAESERYYQFRSGDTITVGLGGDEVVRAVAVTAVPRYRHIRLLSAMMWIDPESFGVARVAYRLAKKIDRELQWQVRRGGRWRPGLHVLGGVDSDEATAEATPDSLDSPPGIFDRLMNGVVNQSLPGLEMDITTVVADYGLWERRHWLPRSVTWRGHIAVIEGISATAPPIDPTVPMTFDWTLAIEDIRERGATSTGGTPATADEALELWSQEGDSISREPESEEPAEIVTIIPADREALTASGLLPPSIREDDRGMDDATLAAIASDLQAIGVGAGDDAYETPSPWTFAPPGKALRLLRYNPVERMSVGTRLRRDFAWGSAELTARIGTAGLDPPDVNLTLRRDQPRLRVLVSFYRALRNGDPGDRSASGPGLYATGDPADFYWAHGASVRLLPRSNEKQWPTFLLRAERHLDIATDTRLDRLGAGASWRPWWGAFDYGSVGGGGRISVQGLVGDNPHVRAVVEGALTVPLPARMSLGMQAGMAQLWGDPASRDLVTIGGTGSWLRGHSGAVRASRIRMARLDLQRPVRFVRLSVFGDWASAAGEDFYAAGVGVTYLDGLFRLDLARGFRRGREGGPEAVFRFHLLDSAFF